LREDMTYSDRNLHLEEQGSTSEKDSVQGDIATKKDTHSLEYILKIKGN